MFWKLPLRPLPALLSLIFLHWGNLQASDHDHPEYQKWCRDLLSGDMGTVESEVVKHLEKNGPQSIDSASWVWTEIQRVKGLRPDDVAKSLPAEGALARALGIFPRIRQLYLDERHRELATEFPIERILASAHFPTLYLCQLNSSNLDRQDESFKLTLRLVETAPGNFGTCWSALTLLSSGPRHHNEFFKQLEAQGEPAQFIFQLLKKYHPDPTPPDRAAKIALANDHLKRWPNDDMAHRFLASIWADSEDWEKALHHSKEEFRLNPFGATTGPNTSVIKHLLRRGSGPEIDQHFALLGKLRSEVSEQERNHFLIRIRCTAYRLNGEIGKAWELIKDHPAEAREDPHFAEEVVRTALAAKRTKQAAEWSRESYLNGGTSDILELYFQALHANSETDEALKLARNPNIDWAMHSSHALYQAAYSTLISSNAYEEATELFAKADTLFPNAGWLKYHHGNALNLAGKLTEARTAFEQAIALRPAFTWGLERYRECLQKIADESNDDTLVSETFAKLSQRFPWAEEIWTTRAKIAGKATASRIWQEAAQAIPGAPFPIQAAFDEALSEEAWQEARKIIAITDDTKSRPDWLQSALLNHIFLALQMTIKGAASPKDIQTGLSQLEDYLKAGGSVSNYHRYRFQFYEKLGNLKESSHSLAAAMEANPDYSNAIHWLFSRPSGEELGGRRFLYLENHIARNPFDGERLGKKIEYHAKWAGSPAVAIAASELLKEIDPEEYQSRRFTIAMSYSNLGDHGKEYRENWANDGGVSPSGRYVGWWNSAREKSQEGSAEVRILEDGATARIRRADGTIEFRRYHPVFGKFEKLQIGDSWVEAQYDEQGNLTRLNTSGKEFIKLIYNDEENAKIAKLESSDGETLTFKYGPLGKPTVIRLEGTGQINVTYSDDGEIESTEAEGLDGEEVGHVLALTVTQSFQKLLGMVKTFESGDLSGIRALIAEDPEHDELQSAFNLADEKWNESEESLDQSAPLFIKLNKATLALAQYNFTNRTKNDSYADEAVDVLENIYYAIPEELQLKGKDANRFVESVSLWLTLLQLQKPDGVTSDDLEMWGQMVQIIDTQCAKVDGDLLKQLFAKASNTPLTLLDREQWLPRSDLSNPGYWQRHLTADVIPNSLQNPVLNASLVRQNGDRVVGSNKGLSVLRRGFWEHFGFDEPTLTWKANPSVSILKASSDVLALAEDSEGQLWIGTANGLMVIDENYQSARWLRTGDGEEGSVQVTHLACTGELAIAGGSNGFTLWTRDEEGNPKLEGRAPGELGRATPALWVMSDGEAILAGLEQGAYLWIPGGGEPPQSLASGNFRSCTWAGDELYLLKDDEIFIPQADEDGNFGEPRRLRGQSGIVKTHTIHGLTDIPVNDDETALGILTDQGISIYRDQHIEHFQLPWADRIVGAHSATWLSQQGLVLASDGIYALKRDQVRHHSESFSTILTHPKTGDIWMAAPSSSVVRVGRNEDGSLEQTNVGVWASSLTITPAGKVIAATGEDILEINEEGEEIPLFNLSEVREREKIEDLSEQRLYDNNRVTGMLADHDGNIWVMTTRVLYRHKKGKTQTFAFAHNPELFPSRSDWLFKIIEDAKHTVWVVASRESHRSFRGQQLSGGLLEWDGERFHRSPISSVRSDWLINGYTDLGNGSGIVGANYGFSLHENSRWSRFSSDLKDPSYLALAKIKPALWMGTSGAKVGEDTWLFGCAGGVVGYKAGQWFYPEDINWMLPDQYLAEYGSRSVHAIGSSPKGFICASTDRGTMIYDMGGAGALSFLVRNSNTQLAVQGFNQRLARDEADLVLDNLDEDSKDAQIVTQLKETQEKIEALQSGLRGVVLSEIASSAPRENSSQIEADIRSAQINGNTEKLKTELARLERLNRSLLLRLEQKNYSLFQALTLNPLDLASKSVRNKLLKPGEQLVQFIPDKEKLFIHLVSRDRLTIREVDVSNDELEKRAIRVSKHLASEASKARGVKLETIEPKDPGQADDALLEDLSWLYDQLLRPVETQLAGSKRIYLVPSGALTYVPFSALVSSTKGTKPVYAIEQYNLGYLTSMFHLDLVLRDEPSINVDTLVFGDPDGSLPGARKEAELVHKKSATTLPILLGKEASLEGVTDQLEMARSVHFATHAVLKPDQSDESFLMCANGQQLTLAEAMGLPMGEVDLVVLSACETGIGARGREYATLARSFAHAGAPTVIATLWRVSDWPSQQVMVEFYEGLGKGLDHFTALSESQRKMAKRSDRLSHPALWAGYVPFGKP